MSTTTSAGTSRPSADKAPQPGAQGGAWAHSTRDGWLVAIAIAGVALLGLSFALFPRVSPAELAALLLLQAALICTNYQCVSHNFTHNEFFRSARMNFCFSVLNSVALGFPQSIFKQHHWNHHKYDNSPLAADGRSPGDLSSLYRYSKTPERPEPLLRYALLSPLRADVLRYAEEGLQRGYRSRLLAESGTLLALMALFALADWRYLMYYYIPLIYLGHVLTYTEGYFEHNKAVPGDRMRNAASCYGRLYNILWFNNGYHQEHHCHPGVHWTRIRPYRDKMLPETQRRVVPHAHCVNF